MSAAIGLISRCAVPVTFAACLVSALVPLLGGPRTIGPWLLVAAGIAAGLTILAARYPRTLKDQVVAQLDDAANLEGALRSAHWFAREGGPGGPVDREVPWIALHLEATASLGAQVDWRRVYERRSARLGLVLAVICAVATLGLAARPLPRLRRPQVETASAAPGATPGVAGASDSLVPQIVEGLRAMSAGGKPSEQQLSAIGQALEVARNDPEARRQLEAQVAGSDANPTDRQDSRESDSGSGAWAQDYPNGFEMSDLEWAYQEALARSRMDDRPRPDPGGEALIPQGADNARTDERQGSPGEGGPLNGSPLEAETRGQPLNLSVARPGRQQASGDAASVDQAAEPGRAAQRAAALRKEVVHASSDVIVPPLDMSAARRRATNAGRRPGGGSATPAPVRYDRSRATQPPALPEARRSLVHDFFLRPADAAPPARRP